MPQGQVCDTLTTIQRSGGNSPVPSLTVARHTRDDTATYIAAVTANTSSLFLCNFIIGVKHRLAGQLRSNSPSQPRSQVQLSSLCHCHSAIMTALINTDLADLSRYLGYLASDVESIRYIARIRMRVLHLRLRKLLNGVTLRAHAGRIPPSFIAALRRCGNCPPLDMAIQLTCISLLALIKPTVPNGLGIPNDRCPPCTTCTCDVGQLICRCFGTICSAQGRQLREAFPAKSRDWQTDIWVARSDFVDSHQNEREET